MFISTSNNKPENPKNNSLNTIRPVLDIFYCLFSRILPFKVYRYLAVGGICFSANFVIFHCSYYYFKHHAVSLAPHIAALLCSLSVTVFLGYYLNNRFVFTTGTLSQRSKLFRYCFTTIAGVIVSTYLLGFLVSMGINITVSFLLNIAIVQCLNYFVQKGFSFKDPYPQKSRKIQTVSPDQTI